jgi:hypothetical protein
MRSGLSPFPDFWARSPARAIGMYVFIAAMLAVRSALAVACTCAGEKPPRVALASAGAVFLGVVTDLGGEYWREMGKTASGEMIVTSGERVYTFRVLAAWKGVESESVLVHTSGDESACGVQLMPGTAYLVYAHERLGELSAGRCSRTRPVSRAEKDLGELGLPSLDRRDGCPTSEFEPGPFCPLHGGEPLVDRVTTSLAVDSTRAAEYQKIASSRFPRSAVVALAGSRAERSTHLRSYPSGNPHRAFVCGACQQAAQRWLLEANDSESGPDRATH